MYRNMDIQRFTVTSKLEIINNEFLLVYQFQTYLPRTFSDLGMV